MAEEGFKIDLTKLPQHVAIIMDGNGRWAKSHNLPRTSGHIEGVRRVEEIIIAASKMGIKVLTLFTFSTENWRRPQNEISVLMQTLIDILNKKVGKLNEYNMRFQMIGRLQGIPPDVLKTIENTTEKTKTNTGMILNMAFNYGARLEIVDAVREIASKVKQGQLNIEEITEDSISERLYTKGLPDPDLLVRTSGEQRVSNFLLWQCSYAEFYFTEKFWPEFNEQELRKAIFDFQNRERRYGTVGSRVS